METWIIITLFAQFLYAAVSILDKILITKTVFKPATYAFYTGVFQILALILIPFGFSMPALEYFLVGLIAGSLFIFGLLILYKAMQIAEVSRIMPIAGGASAIFIFFLAYFFLGERLVAGQIAAFIFFVSGGLLLSATFNHGKMAASKGIALAIAAAFIMSVYYILTKFLFLNISFLSGFIVIQLGGFLGSLALLLSSKNRKAVFGTHRGIEKKTIFLFVPNKILSAVSGVLIFYAISLGSVTIVNSLQAMQYGFLLILAVMLSKKFPEFLKEQASNKVIIQKVAGIILIGVGLFILQK